MKVGFIGLGTMGATWRPTSRRPATSSSCTTCGARRPAPHLAGRRRVGGHAARRSPRRREVVFTSLPGPPEVEAVALGEQGPARGHRRRQGLLRPLAPTRRRWCAGSTPSSPSKGVHMLDAPVSGGPRGRASRASSRSGSAATRTSSTATSRCSTRSATRPLRRADRRGLGRQARAQLRRLRHPDRAGRGLHDGRQGRRRAARAVGGGAPGRQRPAAHLRRARRPVPARQVRSAALRAAAGPQGRLARHRSSAASSACRCASPTWRSRR